MFKTREMTDKKDFSKGKISDNILRLAIPLIAAELVHILYNLVDRMYIGHIEGYGTSALTGLGICLPLITAIGAFTNLCSTGGSSLCAIARGENNIQKAKSIQKTSFTLIIIFGLSLTLLLFAFKTPLLRLLGGDDISLPYALDYFKIYIWGTVFSMISLGMNPFISMQGFPKIGMGTVIIGAVFNIVLDPLFIFGFNMGVKGAAVATVLSQFISCLWVMSFFFGKKALIPITGLGISTENIKEILSLGTTGFVFKITNSMAQAIINITLKTWGGPLSTLYIGSMSIINSLREVVSLPVTGLVDAGKPVIGFNYGAKEKERVYGAIRFLTFACLSVTLLFYILLHSFPRTVIGIFTSDEELLSLCVPCMHRFFALYFMLSLQNTGNATFVALNMPKQAVFFALLRKMILIIPFTLILPAVGLGAMGVFWAEAISDVFGGLSCYLTMVYTVKRIKWN